MTQLDAALQEDITAQLNGDYCDEWKGIEEKAGGDGVNAGAETAEVKDADDKWGRLHLIIGKLTWYSVKIRMVTDLFRIIAIDLLRW